MMKQFIGVNKYQIGLPKAGYSYLFLNLSDLQEISATDAIAKVETMGYDPQIRYMETTNGVKTCALLKMIKLEDSFEENPLGDEWATLAEIFGNAARCRTGRPLEKS